jgi:uncharacterized protein YceH (UPF0502 family)
VELTPVEARVIGCLVEKQRTVPDTYPLSLNALVTACNQSSNRDPVVSYDEATVVAAIDSLKAKGLARIVHPSSGSRATKYRHVLDEALGLEDGPLSVLAVLFLRGAQTAAELRTRTERMHPFADMEELESALTVLASHDEPLVQRLDRRPGEREARWIQLLSPSRHENVGRVDEIVTRTPEPAAPSEGRSLEERVAKLEEEMALLRQALLE